MNHFKNRLDSIWHDHPWRFDFESELGTYYTSRLCTPHIKPRYEETTITEEGSGHKGQLPVHHKVSVSAFRRTLLGYSGMIPSFVKMPELF